MSNDKKSAKSSSKPSNGVTPFKPASALSPVPASAVAAPPAPVADLPTTGRKRAPRGPVKPKVVTVLAKMAKKANRLAKVFTRWGADVGTCGADMANAAASIEKCHVAITALPDDFKPRRAARGTASEAKYLPGEKVDVGPARVDRYSAALEGQTKALLVVKTTGASVVVQTDDGLRMAIPAQHLRAEGSVPRPRKPREATEATEAAAM